MHARIVKIDRRGISDAKFKKWSYYRDIFRKLGVGFFVQVRFWLYARTDYIEVWELRIAKRSGNSRKSGNKIFVWKNSYISINWNFLFKKKEIQLFGVEFCYLCLEFFQRSSGRSMNLKILNWRQPRSFFSVPVGQWTGDPGCWKI